MNAISGSGFDAMGWVPEGQRSGQMSYSTANMTLTETIMGRVDQAAASAATVQGTVSFLWTQPANQAVQIQMNEDGSKLYEVSGGPIALGYQDTVDVIKLCYGKQSQLIVVYGTTANSDGSFPILQVAALA